MPRSAIYATNAPMPEIPFWQLVFMNARIFFVGSDDVPADAKIDARSSYWTLWDKINAKRAG